MNRKKLFICTNLFIFITMIIAVAVTLIYGSRGNRLDGAMTEYWQQIFTFTLQSNIFLGIVALISAIFTLRSYHHEKALPRTLSTWYLVAASATFVTLFTVFFFLAPMRVVSSGGTKSYFDMLLETMFFLHFLNPLLAAVNFIFFYPNPISPTKKSRLLATLPVVIYAIPYILFVVILHVWPDFYGVTFGGRYYLTPLVFVVFWLLSFTAASLLSFLQTRMVKSSNKS